MDLQQEERVGEATVSEVNRIKDTCVNELGRPGAISLLSFLLTKL